MLGAAVVLDSEMLVGSQAGQGPNDIAGLFFLMTALAFLVDGAASAHAARDAAAARAATSAKPEEDAGDELEPGVVEDVPVEETRARSRRSERGPCSWRDSRPVSGSARRSPCWRRSGL